MISPAIRERYLRDPLPIRLGGLAADLARVASFSQNPRNRQAVADLLEEGEQFAEWAALEAPLEIQEMLADVQLRLALWRRRWLEDRPDPSMEADAERWSQELLARAGLID